MKKPIEYKPRVHENWEDVVTAAINGEVNVSFYPKDGEIYIPLGDESMWSLVVKRDGTWDIA